MAPRSPASRSASRSRSPLAHDNGRSRRRRTRTPSPSPPPRRRDDSRRRRRSRSASRSDDDRSPKRRRHRRSPSPQGRRLPYGVHRPDDIKPESTQWHGGDRGGGGGGRGEPAAWERKRQMYEQKSQFFASRRTERVDICARGDDRCWARSPSPLPPAHPLRLNPIPESIKQSLSDDEAKKAKKHKKDKKKKSKKSKKKKKGSGSDSDDWVEITKDKLDQRGVLAGESDEDDVIGPKLPVEATPAVGGDQSAVDRNSFLYRKDLRPGEGQAIAAYVSEGKRIPRRGEIGLQSEDIAKYEVMGYVMSGSRHRRMEATRMRKENQIMSLEEQRMLSTFTSAERAKKEQETLAQFKALVQQKTSKATK